jgi:hypothetical protein
MFRTKPVIAFLLTTTMCAAQPAIVDVQEIVRKSVAATEANWKEAPGYGIVERDVESQKNEPKTIRTYHVQMIDGSPYRTLIAVNDRPLEEAGRRTGNCRLPLSAGRTSRRASGLAGSMRI